MRKFGEWFSAPRNEAPAGRAAETASPAEAAMPEASAPAFQVLDESLPPDSDRTVYKRVPADLLQRARQAALSDQAPQSFDDSDRTAVFAPPRELLTLSKNLSAANPASGAPLDRETPVPDAAVFSRDTARPGPTTEALAPPPQPEEEPAAAPPASGRRRVIGVVALLLLLLLAASFLYMHSGRSLLIPSSATKNG